eukprot:CAMPEP_0197078964 /NCGR_PEP_ID=MMETSP1384-20130603/213379_1 /TAXON_ID=29189 /ORGANISM="Ammonia sp." /LENGTH=1120 /DNA_ID=CAMNT_0042517833 /DNA_START=6 /DNA_END=3369 /DNA_ORIENTATION=-
MSSLQPRDGDRSTNAVDANGSLYYTGFSGGWKSAQAPVRASNEEQGKCSAFCRDPLKLALVISTLALLISLVATMMTFSVMGGRISALEAMPTTYGITNVNETYTPGGYYGWYYRSSYPDLYPLADLHVSVGDRIFFTSRESTSEDLWLVEEEVYETCNFTNTSKIQQLAVNRWLRGGYYTRNESCSTPGEEGCSEKGWIINSYPYNEEGGFTFLVQDWHVNEWGNPLYFASARDWDRWDDMDDHGCLNGIKLRVFVEDRESVPFMEDDGSSFDISTTETVQDLMASIGLLSRQLILQQFNAEQRVRSEGDSGLTNVVPEEVYENCNFSYPYNLTNEYGEMDNTSALWLADPEDMHCDTGTAQEGSACQYEFPIEDWSEYAVDEESDDLFTKLITADTLYFVSSYRWERRDKWSSCVNGLKVKVHIDGYRKLMPVRRSSDAWRDIADSETVEEMNAAIGHISRQLILQQFNAEQRVRSEGDSGLTNVRGQYDGEAAYDDGTYTNGATASIHNHADNIIVVGIGEIAAVLNGVEFQTRHNDYNLNQPSTTDSSYGATEPIAYPEVPAEVSSLSTIAEQVEEMQEWFRAFATQNKSHRNYTDYFKPILCYLEGAWIVSDDTLEEPFDSDRHVIEAKTWKSLHDKIRWMMNSGRKSSLENLAHLPSAIRSLVNDTFPIVSNWEYRVLCAPLNNDIPTSRFRVSDDLHVQLLGSPLTREELYYDRRARFELNLYYDEDNPNDENPPWDAGRKRYNFMDHLMEQIPGKDNYGCNITDEMPDNTDRVIHYVTDKTLNACYYSRFYKLSGADAMGSTSHRRGWRDRNLFAAKTTQEIVSAVEFDFEVQYEDGSVEYTPTVSRWSYSVPLEIIYQTPLSNWNPHGIEFVDRGDFDYSRRGSCGSTSTAFNGWTTNNAYFTPAEFYEGLTSASSADTAEDNVCALDQNGVAQPVYASGHYITFPSIGGGVGKVRQRYPIFPIHEAGTAAFKEVKALAAVLLDDDYDDPITNPDGFFGDERDQNYGFELNLQGGGHQHVCYVSGWRVRHYWYDSDGNALEGADNYITVEGDERESHQHTLELYRVKDTTSGEWQYLIRRCRYGSKADDDQYSDAMWMADKCSDNHVSFSR